MRAESVHAALLVVIIVGLGLAVFAAVESIYPPLQGYCTVNSFLSCSKVDSSSHTTTGPVPDYDIGIAGFLLLLVVDIPFFRTWRPDLLKALVGLSTLGAAISVYFGYIELAVIQALCLVCFSTYLANAAVLGLSLYLLRSSTSDNRDPDPTEAAGDSESSAST
jgi:uncharacterized membrane protein